MLPGGLGRHGAGSGPARPLAFGSGPSRLPDQRRNVAAPGQLEFQEHPGGLGAGELRGSGTLSQPKISKQKKLLIPSKYVSAACSQTSSGRIEGFRYRLSPSRTPDSPGLQGLAGNPEPVDRSAGHRISTSFRVALNVDVRRL